MGLTAFPARFVIKSEFIDNDDLLNSVHASMHIPFWAYHHEAVHGPVEKYDAAFIKRVNREHAREKLSKEK